MEAKEWAAPYPGTYQLFLSPDPGGLTWITNSIDSRPCPQGDHSLTCRLRGSIARVLRLDCSPEPLGCFWRHQGVGITAGACPLFARLAASRAGTHFDWQSTEPIFKCIRTATPSKVVRTVTTVRRDSGDCGATDSLAPVFANASPLSPPAAMHVCAWGVESSTVRRSAPGPPSLRPLP